MFQIEMSHYLHCFRSALVRFVFSYSIHTSGVYNVCGLWLKMVEDRVSL